METTAPTTYYVTWEEVSVYSAYVDAPDHQTAIRYAQEGQTADGYEVYSSFVESISSDNYEAYPAGTYGIGYAQGEEEYEEKEDAPRLLMYGR